MKSNKRIRAMLMATILVLLLGTFVISLSLASAATTVGIDNASADPDATTTTAITAYDVENLGNFGITVTFDPDVVNVTDVTGGPGVGTFSWETLADNQVRLMTLNLPPPMGQIPSLSGDVLLATLTLHAVGSPSEISPLDIEIGQLFDNESQSILATPVNGTVTITGVANQPPYKPNEPLPEDGATNVTTSPTLSVLVSDPDGDSMTVTFYNDSDDNVIDSVTGVASGTRASVIWSGLENVTEYSWYVKANDSEFETESDTWSFTTVAEGAEIHDISIKPDYAGAYDTGIRIDSATEEEIPLDQNLAIGETYFIKYKVENKGTVGEEEGVNITVTVSNATGWSEELASYSQDINAHHLGSVDWHTTGLAEGDYIITVNASILNDANPGNNVRTRAVTFVTIAVDTTAPTTVVTIPPDATTIPSGTELPWTNEDVNISFRRTDNVGGTGVKYTNYSKTSETGPWTTVNATTAIGPDAGNVSDVTDETFNVTVSDEGITKIYYYSVDKNDTPNVEDTKNLTVRIDKTDPVVTDPDANPSSIPADGTATSQLNVTVTDNVGVASVTVNLSELGGSATEPMTNIAGTDIYTATTTAAVGTVPDTYLLNVNATDAAGNYNDTVSIELGVTAPPEDEVPPVVTNPDANPSSIPADGTTTSQLNVTVTDDVGVASVTVNLSELGGSATQPMTKIEGTNTYTTTTTAAVGIAPDTYLLNVNATDTSGNYNNTVDMSLEVTAAPAYGVNLTVNTTAQEVAPDVNATYLLTVNNTGDVANYTLTVDNNVSNADIAVLNRTTITNLAAGANTTVLLNVTDATKGVFIVDVTVTSDTDSNVNDTVSTRTIVKEAGHSAYTIHLKPEYEDISAPLNDTSITDARSLINKINEQGGNCTEFISWNGTAWLSYAPPDDPLNNVTIKGGEGYFVHVTRESDVTFIGTAWEN